VFFYDCLILWISQKLFSTDFYLFYRKTVNFQMN